MTDDDAAIFLGNAWFKALFIERVKPDPPDFRPMEVFEQFAQYAGAALGNGISGFGKVMTQAMTETSAEMQAAEEKKDA